MYVIRPDSIPVNILLFIDSLGGGGSQRQLANLAIGLQQRGHSVTISTYASIEHYRDKVESAGVRYTCFHKSSRFDPSPIFKLAAQIKHAQPGIVIAFLRTPSIYAELVKLRHSRVPLLVSERAGLVNGKLRVTDRVASVLHLVATGIIANSHAYAEGMSAFFSPVKERTAVIYNGVDDAFFAMGDERTKRSALSDSHEKDISTKLITRFCVVAARVSDEKGARILAQALALVQRRSQHQFTVDWIGPANNNDIEVEATNTILKNNNMSAVWTWRGHEKDIGGCYEKYDALICPSLHEGVPNVLCESMACALPAIATNVGDNAHILETNESGLVCAPDDPEALAECILRFLAMSRQQRISIGKKAYNRARTLFSMGNYIDCWESVIQEHT